MDTLLDLPVMDIIAGFIIVLIALFMIMTRIAMQQWQRANKLDAELFKKQGGRDLADQQMRGMISYINTHRCTWQQPGFPLDEFTVDWMAANGIRKHDAQALIYKYLAKALRPNENN